MADGGLPRMIDKTLVWISGQQPPPEYGACDRRNDRWYVKRSAIVAHAAHACVEQQSDGKACQQSKWNSHRTQKDDVEEGLPDDRAVHRYERSIVVNARPMCVGQNVVLGKAKEQRSDHRSKGQHAKSENPWSDEGIGPPCVGRFELAKTLLSIGRERVNRRDNENSERDIGRNIVVNVWKAVQRIDAV